ncbi:MAG: hypothetical protein PUF63_08975 [Prevotella sp.]|nr:hypothetical protein [Prevotella sp.]
METHITADKLLGFGLSSTHISTIIESAVWFLTQIMQLSLMTVSVLSAKSARAKKGGCAYANLAEGDKHATPAVGGRPQAGHDTTTGGVHLHGLYRLRLIIRYDDSNVWIS